MRTHLVFGTLSLAVLTACNDSTSPAGPRRLQLSLTGLEPLANGFHYEGWAMIGGQPVTTGKFNIGSGGSLVTVAGVPIANGTFDASRDLGGATAIVITIEPAGDVDAVPAATKVLAGSVSNAAATLSVGASQALNTDFASAAGKFVLATPTTAATDDERSGVWFLDLSSGTPAAGLTLPTLPAGWKYEGWAVVNGTPVTTGRFVSATGADEAAPFSGPTAGPPFPGEDFIRNAPAGVAFPTDLRGRMIVISVEPNPDDSPAPFALKPLLATVSATAVDHVTYALPRNTAALPAGTATLLR